MMDSYIFDGNDPERRKQRVVKALMNPPQDVGSGIAAIGDAMAYRSQQKAAAFPKAPDGAKSGMFGRLFGMFGKKGLY